MTRLLRRKILTAVLAPIVFLALMEGVLRLFGYRFDPVQPGASERPFDELEMLDVYRPDPDLLWTLRPSTVIDNLPLGFVRVRTNSLGLRGPEVPDPRDPNDLLVVCLGDSIVFGIGLAEADTLPSRLQKALAERPEFRGRPVRVINGGLPGWSSVQGRRLLDRLAPLRPDAVVFWFGMNDAQKARERPDEFQRPAGEGFVRTTSILRSLRTFQLMQEGILSLGGAEDFRRVTPEQFARTVEDITRRASDGGPVPVFVRTPNRLALTASQLRAVLRRGEEERAQRIYGPLALLSPIGPAEPGVDLVGRKVAVKGQAGPALLFGPDPPEADSTLEAVRTNLDIAESTATALETILAKLPPDSVTGEEMYPGIPPREIFIDNCHLTPLGTRLAARTLAERIATALAR